MKRFLGVLAILLFGVLMLLLPVFCRAQSKIPFAIGRGVQDTAYTTSSMLVNGVLRLPSFVNSNANVGLSTDATGKVVLRTFSGGGGGGTTYVGGYGITVVAAGLPTGDTVKVDSSKVATRNYVQSNFLTSSSALNATNLLSGTIPAARYGTTQIPVTSINATGTPSSTTFLRGDGSWSAFSTPSLAAVTAVGNTATTSIFISADSNVGVSVISTAETKTGRLTPNGLRITTGTTNDYLRPLGGVSGTFTHQLPNRNGVIALLNDLSDTAAALRTAIGGGGGSGTVTSVAMSGGTTGLTFSGGPITGTGTFTAGGTLAAANGGTGFTSLAALKFGLSLDQVPNVDMSNIGNVGTGVLSIAHGGTGTLLPGLVAGTNVTITGSWPNQTINSSGGGGGSMAIGGAITSATAGSMLYAGASGNLAQDNSNLFYDYTNHRNVFGGTTSRRRLTVYGTDFDGTYGGDYYGENSDAVGAAVTLRATSAGGHTISMISTGSGATGGAGQWAIYDHTVGSYSLRFAANNYLTMNVSSTDNVGAGILIKGSREYVMLATKSGSGSGADLLTVYDNSAGAFRTTWDASGNVGINTTSPAYKLDVNGTAHVAGVMNFGSVSNYANNAAAVAGGLSVGDVYRNGDVLMIVH